MSILDVDLPEDHVARTLTCDIKIAVKPRTDETLMSDCGFLRHNQAAEDLYGCSLAYRYKSQFRSKDATLHAQCRMIASRQGSTDYNSSSLNYLIRADGEGVWIRQDVTTYQEDGITYWLTALYPSSQPGLATPCNLNDYGVTLTEVQAACGVYTIADIQALPENLTPALPFATIIPGGLKICKVAGQASLKTGSVGAFLQEFVHCCQVCGWLWGSRTEKPQQCARRGKVKGESTCGSWVWWRR